MPITAEAVGTSYPPTNPYRVTEERIAAFADALGDPNPVYRSGGRVPAPPTFAMVVAAQTWNDLFGDPRFGIALARTMHTEQKFTFRRPIFADDQLSAQLRISSVRARGQMELIGIQVELTTTDGEPVCNADSVLMHQEPPVEQSNPPVEHQEPPVEPVETKAPTPSLRGAEGDAAIQPPAEPAPTTRPIADVQLPHLDWSSLGPDQQLGQLLIPVTRTRLVRYAGASGDFNPIHHSDFAAHALGLDSVIAHGMWTMGAALRVVTDTFSPGQLTSCQTRFTKPVPVPDDGVGSVLEVGAAVSAIEESGAKLAITAECRGVRVLSATRAEVSRP